MSRTKYRYIEPGFYRLSICKWRFSLVNWHIHPNDISAKADKYGVYFGKWLVSIFRIEG